MGKYSKPGLQDSQRMPAHSQSISAIKKRSIQQSEGSDNRKMKLVSLHPLTWEVSDSCKTSTDFSGLKEKH